MRFPVKNFIAHARHIACYGYNTELQLSSNNEAARYRITYHRYDGTKMVFVGQWQEIKYTKRGRAYIMDWHNYRVIGKVRRLHLENFFRL